MYRFLFVGFIIINCAFKITESRSDDCTEKKHCDECIATIGCTWCEDLAYTSPRCNLRQEHTCPGPRLVNVSSSLPTITKNDPISNFNSMPMRIQPQSVNLKLAVGQKSAIDLAYRDGTDKQLDLYYILDLSATMADDRDTVSKSAKHLVTELRKITRDVQLGFGAFVDKPVLPFVSSDQLRQGDGAFDIPYGFRNHLKLTTSESRFESTVQNAKISRNLDEPEGTLDALMQAVVCKEEIGWRNSSRKLIVVATDGPFHIAGDGKLGGIVRPNDMKCHLDSNGHYTHSTILDYPSIGETNAVILENQVYVIFAISEDRNNENDNVFKFYDLLAKHITASTARRLSHNSSDVVQVIKQKYEEISSTVQLFIEEKPDFVEVAVWAKCPKSNKLEYRLNCTSVAQDQRIEFKIEVTLRRCPPRSSSNVANKVVVSFFELTQREKLNINLNYKCSCPCSQEHIQRESDLQAFCNGPKATKYITCGTCTCQDDRYGEKCQCSKTDDADVNQDTTKCIHIVEGRNVTCSNKGECKCGQCECERDQNGLVMHNGKYCQFSTEQCKNPKNPGRLCSENGRCIEEKCVCNAGYDGKYCQCETAKKYQCTEPGKPLSQHCNGHGECDCDSGYRCKCKPEYDGAFCDVCKSNCQEEMCVCILEQETVKQLNVLPSSPVAESNRGLLQTYPFQYTSRGS